MFKLLISRTFLSIHIQSGRNSKSTTLTMFATSWACYLSKMTFMAFPQKKPCIKPSKNTLFGTFNQIADP
jgi:hypothetical protein